MTSSSTPIYSSKRIFVSYEDRLELLDGLKLLCLSFKHHCPTETLKVFLPKASDDLLKWAKQHLNQNIHVEVYNSGVKGWSIKPEIMLKLFEEGYDEIIWFDSDILITADLCSYLNLLDERIVVLCDSQGVPDDCRTTFWNLIISRRFDRLVNTCFIRFTRFHKELLLQWRNLVYRQEFQEIQQLPFEERPSYLFGDQDLLEGLLMSDRFHKLPVKFLRHGYEMIHTSNLYSSKERLRVLWQEKPVFFLHAHGIKPWMLIYRQPSSSNITDVIVELSPYITEAKFYRHLLDSDTSWMDSRTALGYLCSLLGWNNPHLRGLFVTFTIEIQEKLKSVTSGSK